MVDVVIIGGGPTGLSAAVITAKAGKSTLVLDTEKGIYKRAWLKNLLGFEEITGVKLVEAGKKQAEKYGAELVQEAVLSVSREDDVLKVTTENRQIEAKHVIIATGLSMDVAEKSGLATVPGTEPKVKAVIQTDRQGKTSMDGVWAAGVVAGCSIHTSIVMGDGAKVGINVVSELNGERHVDHDVVVKA